ncbi:MAG: hypothetical protein BWX59_02501 [Bacteroidetes bacterium ADurb.Bin028]|nr:MAG: hypothetical protein BWX59_02501 [Bacteroidetes bacterium ADurb.Bin028]
METNEIEKKIFETYKNVELIYEEIENLYNEIGEMDYKTYLKKKEIDKLKEEIGENYKLIDELEKQLKK